MNIVYIDHYAGGPSYGMEFRPCYLAREWGRAGHDVTVVGASFSHLRTRQPFVPTSPTVEAADGFRYLWFPTPSYSGNGAGRVVSIVAFLARLRGLGRHLAAPPDMVIASSTYPLDIYPARRLARACGARLVWEVHDLWPLTLIELGGFSRVHPFIMLLQKAENDACAGADAVVSILPETKSHLIAHGMAPEKFAHVPNGFDAAEWEGADAALEPGVAAVIDRARQGRRLVIGYAGGHGASNALDALIEAAALCRDDPVSFVLAGDGPEKPSLQVRAHALGLEHVHFLPSVPKAEVPALLRSMDVLYAGLRDSPLYRFGIGLNKLVDYMMAGRPILLSGSVGGDPVAASGCGLTVAPADPLAIAAGARTFAAMGEAARAAMGVAGQGHARAGHDYRVLARRFLEATGAG